MRRGLLVAVVALPLLAACGTTTTTRTVSRTTSTPSTSTQAAAGPVYFQGVAGTPAQKPSALQLTGDGTLVVERVQWTSWGGPEAVGTGSANYHGCTPNCAQAPAHTALVSVRLTRIRTCAGRRYYSGVLLRLNSGQLLNREFLQRSWSPC